MGTLDPFRNRILNPPGVGTGATITGATIPAGAVDGDYLKIESGNLAVAAANESDSVVDFDKNVQVPPGTIFIGPATGLSAGIRALSVHSDITGNNALLLAQLFNDTTGFEDAFTYSSGAPENVAMNPVPGTATSDNARFSITTTADELLTRLSITTNQISAAVPFAIVGRTTSHTGTIAISFAGDVNTDSSGVASIDLANDLNPILVDSGTELFFTVACDGMFGIVNGPDFRPNAVVRRIVITRVAVGSGGGVTVEDEGVALTGDATTFNFVGAGVTATGAGAEKTITIPGATGIAGRHGRG